MDSNNSKMNDKRDKSPADMRRAKSSACLREQVEDDTGYHSPTCRIYAQDRESPDDNECTVCQKCEDKFRPCEGTSRQNEEPPAQDKKEDDIDLIEMEASHTTVLTNKNMKNKNYDPDQDEI